MDDAGLSWHGEDAGSKHQAEALTRGPPYMLESTPATNLHGSDSGPSRTRSTRRKLSKHVSVPRVDGGLRRVAPSAQATRRPKIASPHPSPLPLPSGSAGIVHHPGGCCRPVSRGVATGARSTACWPCMPPTHEHTLRWRRPSALTLVSPPPSLQFSPACRQGMPAAGHLPDRAQARLPSRRRGQVSRESSDCWVSKKQGWVGR